MIVAITGLKPFNLLKKIHFLSLSVPLMKKALVSKGNLHGHSFQNKGYFHTVTAWDTRECMMEYVYSPAHQKAIDIFEKLGEGKTCYDKISRKSVFWSPANWNITFRKLFRCN